MWTPSATQVLIAAFTLLLGSLIRRLVRFAAQQRREADALNAPCDPYWPVLGNLPEAIMNQEKALDFWVEKTQRHGSTWKMIIPPRPPLLFVMDPRDVEYVLKINWTNFPKGPFFQEIFRDMLGYGIFVENGEHWRSQRHAAAHIFKVRSMREHVRRIAEHCDELEDCVRAYLPSSPHSAQAERCPHTSQPYVDLCRLMHHLTLDSIGEIAFGTKLHILAGERARLGLLDPSAAEHTSCAHDFDAFARSFDFVQKRLDRRFLNPFWRFSPAELVYKRHMSFINGVIYSLINERKEDPKLAEKSDLLSRCLLHADEQGKPYTDEYIRDIVLNILLAGRDTTAQTLSYTIGFLANHPDVTAKLCAEIDAFFASGHTLCYEDLNKDLHYMRAVLDETLRLCPPVPADPKEVVEADVLPSGVRVQPGVTVLWSAYCMGRMKSVWGEDAEEFRPERWLDEEGHWRQPVDYWEHVPFQAGPRICLGRLLAYLECKAVLCALFSKFTFTPLRGHVVTYAKSATLAVRDGVKVHVHLRNKTV
mmetsp:Transcript_29401/g.74000  ORF Transcript_29401/g.74000 Transcript_29401/m.74000 type:complete len:534 (-) Transcript_29401:106-1707(-)|eukprot:CAMPEP_0174239894 /NCGR_PEP_ID=MMETSP0417-20130205/16559_1 /TAXON_ID=242541 /ORGANISM="Mayorella sp, Strain BSH-02190019" /LENGTH=533 /DNA_ID=CAMNT_0015318889 /DNA_START=143 /DNA_END=1744 /DNA_ORIENTATION=+